MRKIAILGGGGFCREVKCLIDDINNAEPTYELIGYFDDCSSIVKSNGMSYLGEISQINSVDYDLALVVAIADPRTREKIIQSIDNKKISYPNLLHPSILKSEDEILFGHGNIVCAGNILTCNISINNFVIINLSCSIGHDTIIEDYCSIMPKVSVSGEVILSRSSYIGTGAIIINKVTIGEYTTVGAGAVVSKNLPPNCTAVGIPAKPIKYEN